MLGIRTHQPIFREATTLLRRKCTDHQGFFSRSLVSCTIKSQRNFTFQTTRRSSETAAASDHLNFSSNATLQRGPTYRPVQKLGSAKIQTDIHNANSAIKLAKVITSCQSTPSSIFPGSTEVKPKAPRTITSEGVKFKDLVALSKPRLTALVVLSSMAAYALAPCEMSLMNLMCLTIGTALCSASANSINMAREHILDGLMTRTRNRPIVRGAVSRQQAFVLAAICGIVGTATLYYGINPTVSALGFANIVLYGGIYTSMKRVSVANTWVGAVVGAIPPLMGWAVSNDLTDPGAWPLAALLYCWQFPHFMALSHNIRGEYQRAGYVMAAWTNPALNARVALRHSIAMFPICIAMSYFNITDWFFTVDSAVVNGWLTYTAYKFWQIQRHDIHPLKFGAPAPPSPFARQLFWGSVIHLPTVLVLAMIHKKGHWELVKAKLGFESGNEF